MMSLKENKAITLIALIITIIIMLILVGVTVAVALNGGLFTTAKDAVRKTQLEEDREVLQAAILGSLNEKLEIESADSLKSNLPEGWNVKLEEIYICISPSENEFQLLANGTILEEIESIIWTQNGEEITNGEITLHVGDYINYNPAVDEKGNSVTTSYTSYSLANASKNSGKTSGYTSDQKFSANSYTGTWQVFGVENGKIQIVPTSIITTSSTSNGYYYLQGESGYLNGINELNSICSIYGEGKGAVGAKAITIEEIERATGYDPTRTSGYGDKYQYRYPTSDEASGTRYLEYRKSTDNGNSWTNWISINNDFNNYGSINYHVFKEPGSSNIISSTNEGITEEITNNRFSMSAPTTHNKVDYSDNIAKLIWVGSYWIGSNDIYVYYHQLQTHSPISTRSYVLYGIKYISGSTLTGATLFNSYIAESSYNCGIRPVVSLRSDIKLVENGDNNWNIE